VSVLNLVGHQDQRPWSIEELAIGSSEETTGLTQPVGCMRKSQYGWSFNGSKEEPWPTSQLYAHVHAECEEDFEYIAKAEFYAENEHGNSPLILETNARSCYGNRIEELTEGFQTIDEANPGDW